MRKSRETPSAPAAGARAAFRPLYEQIRILLTQSLVAGFSHLGTDNAAHASGLIAGFAIGAMLPVSQRLGGTRAGNAVRVAGAVAAILAVFALGAAAIRGIHDGF